MGFFFLIIIAFPVRYVAKTKVGESINKQAANKFSGHKQLPVPQDNTKFGPLTELTAINAKF